MTSPILLHDRPGADRGRRGDRPLEHRVIRFAMTEIKASSETDSPPPALAVRRARLERRCRTPRLWPSAAFHPWRRASIRRLGELKDIHRGQRCFIIGNGPSLKQTDLTRLRR